MNECEVKPLPNLKIKSITIPIITIDLIYNKTLRIRKAFDKLAVISKEIKTHTLWKKTIMDPLPKITKSGK